MTTFDFNNIDRFEVLDWPALCQLLLACLKQYEGWLEHFNVQTGWEGRYDRDIKLCRRMIEDMETWIEHGATRKGGHLVNGVRVYDGMQRD